MLQLSAPVLCVPLLLSLVILVGGCKPKPDVAKSNPSADPQFQVPVVGQVVVQQMTPVQDRLPGVVLDDVAITKAVRDQIVKAAIFAATEPAPDRPVADVLLGYSIEDVRAEGKALARAIAQLRVRVKPAKLADPYWAEDVEASAELPYKLHEKNAVPVAGAFTSLVSRLTSDLLADYLARQKLRTASEDEIVKLVSAGEAPLREEGIRQAGQRNLKKAVPTLLALLTDESEPVRDSALGALLAMRERGAVPVLAASRSMRDRREMRKIVEAIALLGGDEAISYLEFVADANEDPEIQSLAKRSLERLRRK